MLRKHLLVWLNAGNNKGACFFLTSTNTFILLFSQSKYIKFMANIVYWLFTYSDHRTLIKTWFSKTPRHYPTYDNIKVSLPVGAANFKVGNNISRAAPTPIRQCFKAVFH